MMKGWSRATFETTAGRVDVRVVEMAGDRRILLVVPEEWEGPTSKPRVLEARETADGLEVLSGPSPWKSIIGDAIREKQRIHLTKARVWTLIQCLAEEVLQQCGLHDREVKVSENPYTPTLTVSIISSSSYDDLRFHVDPADDNWETSADWSPSGFDEARRVVAAIQRIHGLVRENADLYFALGKGNG